METLLNPEILRVAASSTLGVLSLSMVLLASISLAFFRKASESVRLLVFVLMLCGVVGIGYAVVSTSQKVEISSVTDRHEKVVEKIFVPANGESPVLSSSNLKRGQEYTLEVSGTFEAGDTITADADYSITKRIHGDGWTDMVMGYEQFGDEFLNLKVIGYGQNGSIDWGSLKSNHVYRATVVGTGQPLQLLIYDIWYPNNSGGLEVNILCDNC